jgi:hypothetical protein
MILRWVTVGAGLAAAAYLTHTGVSWYRFGRLQTSPGGPDEDPLLDRFMPVYEVRESHHVRVGAPAGIVLEAARHLDIFESRSVRAIFRARELLLGGTPGKRPRPGGLLAEVQSLGWSVLAEIPDREIVVGAVTRPWQADVVFRGVPGADFAAFREPGYVKIAWTLRADPLEAGASVFRTETRAVATDPGARARFRIYWSFVAPGVALIRRLGLRPLRRAAERAGRASR